MVAVLQPIRNNNNLIPIDRAVVLVGRGSDCDAIVQNSQKISRRHCCLVQVDDTYYIRDLGSMNGIWVNGNRVTREEQLKTGDRVAVGDVEYLFHARVRLEQRKTAQQVPPDGKATIPDKPEDLPPRKDAQKTLPPEELAQSVPDAIMTTDSEEADLISSGKIKLVERPAETSDFADADDVLVLEDSSEMVLDDVIPLGSLPSETNELEALDVPIVDDFEDVDDDDDEILILE